MVLPTVYVSIPGAVTFIKPALPVLNIEPADGLYVLEDKLHQFPSNMQLFRELNVIESTIVQQIASAIDAIFLEPLIDQTIGSIMKSIPTIIDRLFDTYGDMSPKELSKMHRQVEQMTYDPVYSINKVFIAIDRLGDIAEICLRTYSREQKVNLAYIILQNTRKFSAGLGKWDTLRQQQSHVAIINGDPILALDFQALNYNVWVFFQFGKFFTISASKIQI